MRCARALLGFLTAHGEHIHDLELFFFAGGDLELSALVISCLGACGSAATGLQRLSLRVWDTELENTAWLLGLTALQTLELSCNNHKLSLPTGMSRLTALTDAKLKGAPHPPEAAASLPSSLTRLCLDDSSSPTLMQDAPRGPMPLQASELGGNAHGGMGSLVPVGSATCTMNPDLWGHSIVCCDASPGPQPLPPMPVVLPPPCSCSCPS